MKSKGTKHLLALCLGLSLGWHILGALAIGTGQEPVCLVAQGVVPALCPRVPLEVLTVGVESDGTMITRPVADERDPEYFGFPRMWEGTWGAGALGRFSRRPVIAGGAHLVTEGIQEIQIPLPAPEKISKRDLGEGVLEISNLEPDMLGLARSLEGSKGLASLSNTSGASLVLSGPLATRRYLIQVLPKFEEFAMGKNRMLVLGHQKMQRGDEGLIVRFWVCPSGEVRCTMLESSSGDPQMDNIALGAIRQWRFEENLDASAPNQWGRVTLQEGE